MPTKSFTLQVHYSCPLTKDNWKYELLMPCSSFLRDCETKCLTNDDGYGYPARQNGEHIRYASVLIYPSIRSIIPEDATHIVWFNR